MRVIFLDVDGVLNNLEFLKKRQKLLRVYKDMYLPRLDDNNFIVLKELVDKTEAKLVLSSSWRMFFNEDLIPNDNSFDSPGRNLIEKLNSYGLSLDGRTELKGRHEGYLRGDFIRDYLEEHPLIDSFVILDDDNDMREFTDTNLIRTDSLKGLTRDDIMKAETIFKKQEKSKRL